MAPIRSKLMEISYSDPKFQIRLTGCFRLFLNCTGRMNRFTVCLLFSRRSPLPGIVI